MIIITSKGHHVLEIWTALPFSFITIIIIVMICWSASKPSLGRGNLTAAQFSATSTSPAPSSSISTIHHHQQLQLHHQCFNHHWSLSENLSPSCPKIFVPMPSSKESTYQKNSLIELIAWHLRESDIWIWSLTFNNAIYVCLRFHLLQSQSFLFLQNVDRKYLIWKPFDSWSKAIIVGVQRYTEHVFYRPIQPFCICIFV